MIIPPLPRALERRQDTGRLRRARNANGQALAYVYSRDDATEALQAKMLRKDEARRIAINMARLPNCAGRSCPTKDMPLFRPNSIEPPPH
jgi:hypothetical protein